MLVQNILRSTEGKSEVENVAVSKEVPFLSRIFHHAVLIDIDTSVRGFDRKICTARASLRQKRACSNMAKRKDILSLAPHWHRELFWNMLRYLESELASFTSKIGEMRTHLHGTESCCMENPKEVANDEKARQCFNIFS